MDFRDLPPDTIMTEEMLEPQVEEFILVVEHPGKHFEAISYKGHNQIEAFAKYKDIKHKDKTMCRAMVTYSAATRRIYGVDFIIGYEIIEKLTS